MYEPLRRLTLAALKVPPKPQPPIGRPASLRVFRAGRSYYRWRLVTWIVAQVLALGAILFWSALLIGVENVAHQRAQDAARPAAVVAPAEPVPADAAPPASAEPPPPSRNFFERIIHAITSAAEKVAPPNSARPGDVSQWVAGYKRFVVELALLLPPWAFPLLWVVKLFSLAIYLLQIPITYAVRRLDFEMRWYMVTDRSLRLRHGVWNVSESTMSFANVQQVTVIQGPVQRLLGLANVKVQSAGGGSGRHEHQKIDDDMHVGMFRHVTNAPEIRDLILERLRQFRESGLGDPEEAPVAAASAREPAVLTSSASATTAARELLAEARALRGVLAG